MFKEGIFPSRFSSNVGLLSVWPRLLQASITRLSYRKWYISLTRWEICNAFWFILRGRFWSVLCLHWERIFQYIPSEFIVVELCLIVDSQVYMQLPSAYSFCATDIGWYDNLQALRVDVCKNQTRGGQTWKIDFAHTFKLESSRAIGSETLLLLTITPGRN